mmetsp:Transcript_26841/g.86300  ORF Transcript_26841/g.86300 Transcript_26841/m.86300 type:complete len:250 (-) Transcript_26841:416-1165(-)
MHLLDGIQELCPAHGRLEIFFLFLHFLLQLCSGEASFAQIGKHQPHGHHGGIAAHVRNVSTAVSIGEPSQFVWFNVSCDPNILHAYPKQLLASFEPRERDVDALFQSSAQRFVQIPRHVGGSEYNDWLALILGCLAHAIHLDQKLRLDAPAGLMLGRRPTGTGECIDLVEEDGRRSVVLGHVKQEPHHFLAVATVLAGQRRGRTVEEGGSALSGHRLCQHRLPCARGAEHEHPFPRATNPLEVVGHPQW